MAINEGKRPSLRAQGKARCAADSTEPPPAEKPTSKLIHVRMDEEMVDRIDDFRFENRFHDRTRTVRWLLKWALNHAPKEKKPSGKPPKKGGGR